MNKDIVGNKRVGLLLTILLTFIVFVVYFGANPITHLKTNYFSNGGDLMKDIYATTYHVKYDSSYLHCGAMNYPYGDYYTYCGTVPYVSFPIQVLHNMGVTNAPNYVNAFLAFLVIASLFLSALFLFLLLKELGVHPILSVLAAVAITFLSPQIDRIGGHLTLSFVCVYPMMIYFLVKHYKTAKYRYCIYFGLLMLFAGMSHPYFLVTFAYVSAFYCIFIFFKDKQKFNGIKGVLMCLLFQLILPTILFYLIWGYGDTPADRTAIPWGFYEYRGRVEGLLFFHGRPFWGPLKKPVEWESFCYIGTVSCIMLVVIVISMIVAECKGKFKEIFAITDNPVLNVLFYAAFLMALVSCAFPVMFGLNVLKYLGPLAQMRAVGRFLMLSYYVMNVIAIYLIAHFSKKIGGKVWPVVFAVLAVGIYAYDVNRNCTGYKQRYNNDIPCLSDVNNELDVNQWVKETDWKDKYQAVLPLSFIHVGSEHIWLNCSQKRFFDAVYVSLKTGLPMMSNSSSRASIKNTYKTVSISMLPVVDYPFLKDLPNDKPLLVIVSDTAVLKDNDNRVLSYSSFLAEHNDIKFYTLEIDSLYKLCADFRHELAEKVQKTEPSTSFYYENWDSADGSLLCKLDEKTLIFDGDLPSDDASFLVSFWVGDYLKDLHSRSTVRIYEIDENGQQWEIRDYQLHKNCKAVYDECGIIEFLVNTSGNNKHLRITLENVYEPLTAVPLDNLLIRPNDTHAVTESEGRVFYDNLPVVDYEFN